MGPRLTTFAACLMLTTCVASAGGADVTADDRELPAAELLEYGPESPSYVAIGDVRALADTATGLDMIPVTAIAGIPALRVPFDAIPWLDADAISEFAHFGPTGTSTEGGPAMITVIATSQDPDDLTAELVAAGWVRSGTNRFASDAPWSEVAGANWVHIGDGVVILAPHSRHLDVALDDAVETSTDSPIIEALARAEGNRRISFALDNATECSGVVAAGDDAAGGGTVVLAVGDTAQEARIEVDQDTYFDRRGMAVHAVDHTLDSGYLVISTAVDDPDLRTHLWSTTTLLGGDTILELGELYRC
jgi:hypothetical protein